PVGRRLLGSSRERGARRIRSAEETQIPGMLHSRFRLLNAVEKGFARASTLHLAVLPPQLPPVALPSLKTRWRARTPAILPARRSWCETMTAYSSAIRNSSRRQPVARQSAA